MPKERDKLWHWLQPRKAVFLSDLASNGTPDIDMSSVGQLRRSDPIGVQARICKPCHYSCKSVDYVLLGLYYEDVATLRLLGPTIVSPAGFLSGYTRARPYQAGAKSCNQQPTAAWPAAIHHGWGWRASMGISAFEKRS